MKGMMSHSSRGAASSDYYLSGRSALGSEGSRSQNMVSKHLGKRIAIIMGSIVFVVMVALSFTTTREQAVLSMQTSEQNRRFNRYWLRLGLQTGRLQQVTDNGIIHAFQIIVNKGIKESQEGNQIDNSRSQRLEDAKMQLGKIVNESMYVNRDETEQSMLSLGKLQTFEGGDLEDRSVLAKLVEVRSFKNEIIITMVNEVRKRLL